MHLKKKAQSTPILAHLQLIIHLLAVEMAMHNQTGRQRQHKKNKWNKLGEFLLTCMQLCYINNTLALVRIFFEIRFCEALLDSASENDFE